MDDSKFKRGLLGADSVLGSGSSPNQGAGSGLLGLGAMIANHGQLYDVSQIWFNEKSIHLDGYRFINCSFESSTLYVNSLRFELINCKLDGKSQIIYGNEVLKIIHLWYSRSEEMYRDHPYFAPHRNPNGTITIKNI